MTTKAADKIIGIADSGVTGVMRRAGKHFGKVKKIVKKPIDKNAAGLDKVASGTGKVAGAGLHIGAGLVDISAAILLKLSQIFVAGTDGLLADNKILDFMKEKHATKKVKKNKEGKDKKLSNFTKNNPRVAAYLTWYLMLLTAIGGVGGVANKDKIADTVKSKIEKIKGGKDKSEDDDTIYLDKTYSVQDASFRQNVVNENWSEIVVGLLEFETYRGANPKKQSGESRYTYGPGITWVYENGKQNACNGVYVDKVKNFSEEEIWNQARQHCLFSTEVLGIAQTYLKKEGFETVTDQQIVGLLFAGYQTPASLRGIISKLKQAGNNTQKIVDAFIAGEEVNVKWRKGTNKRRWWCAMYYIGKISAVDFLSMDRDAFSKIEDINTIMRNGHFVYDDSTIEYALNCKNKNTGTVHEFIVAHSALSDIEQNLGKTVKHKDRKKQDVNPSMEQMLLALNAYEAKDYDKAIVLYKKAIKLDKHNMEAYSSLALSYKKRGDITHSMDDYNQSLKMVRKHDRLVKSDKHYIYDAEVESSIRFNAGLAYEEIAKLEISSGDIKSAQKSYQKAKENFEKALSIAQESGNEGRAKTYENAVNRIKQALEKLSQQQNKKTAFVSGTKKVKAKQKENSRIVYGSRTEYEA